jgi:hypothetical protein
MDRRFRGRWLLVFEKVAAAAREQAGAQGHRRLFAAAGL